MHTGYKSLEIYRSAHELGVRIHHFSLKLPRFENYESGSQLRRASKSISANIVEGYGRRRYKSDWIKFLIYAHFSCLETQEWLEYVLDCHENLVQLTMSLLQDVEVLGRQINKFLQAVEREHRSVKQDSSHILHPTSHISYL